MPIAPLPRLSNVKWLNFQNELCNNMTIGDYSTLSIGDSIIADLSRYSNIWKRYFKSLNALNSGIGGDRVRNNLWRCQNLPSIQHLQHLMCVVSNIQHNSVENVVDGIVEIPLSLRCKHYPIILFFCCLLPRDNNWSINNQLASV